MRKPDLFIVGAPRCGTSAMHRYLQQHPEIFMSEPKEPNFFGSDLPFRTSPPLTMAQYLDCFATAQDKKRAGESSVKYLPSRRAAAEIKDFCGGVSILIMLRNPVDMMYSLHAHFFHENQEDIPDFPRALEVEEDRRWGRRLPKHLLIPKELLVYRQMAQYTQQVQRYIDVFGRDNVHVIIFEEFARETARVYRDTLRFLGVKPDFKPEFVVINPNRRARSALIKRYFLHPRMAYWLETYKSSALGLPCRRFRDWLIALKHWNTQETRRAPMDPGLRRRLQQEFAPEVERLSSLLGRDLTCWTVDG